MLTKILIPTDGSTLGNISALEGVSMAQKVGAEVVGIYVAREAQNPLFDFSEIKPKNYPSKDEYSEMVNNAGHGYLAPIKEAAEKAGIRFSSVIKISNATARTIVETAEEQKCSMIFMGSHGCAGWGHNLLGSVATKVLSSTQIPTLIYRLRQEPSPDQEKRATFVPRVGV
ncbi:MAG: teaD 2 [Burkholderiaceae bacterium]|nr:teaD 2 [Burkholderiaceae bacterium]